MPQELLLRKLLTVFPLYFSKMIIRRHFFFELYFFESYYNVFYSWILRDLTLFLFKSLGDIVVIDYPSKDKRFTVVYNMLSYKFYTRLFFFCTCGLPIELKTNNFYINSLTGVFSSSHWLEREGWDLFGIFFQDNFDLRRILTDYGFEGYPLRKDFPLTGFLEVRYDDEQRSVIYENLELSQEYRFFDFESPWENV